MTMHPPVRRRSVLWARRPAESWASEAFPVGNGRLGAMVFGGVLRDRIQLNEQSFWGGVPDYDNGAAGVSDDVFDTGVLGFGAYRTFGDLEVAFEARPGSGDVTGYRRELAVDTGLHSVEFDRDGATYRREVFVSRAADVILCRYETDEPDGLTGTVALRSGPWPGRPAAAVLGPDGVVHLRFDGVLENGLAYAAEARVRADGDTRTGAAGASFSRCTQIEIRIDLRTNHAPDPGAGWRGTLAPADLARATLDAVDSRTFESLRQQHGDEFAALMGRVRVEWGSTERDIASLPTADRLARYDADDPELEQLHFDYGRYLLASCSRPDGLPANLQGLWNDEDQPAWAGDYHTNVNVQMNYWGAESTALPEAHEALVRFVESVAVPCRAATRHAFGEHVRGWTARTSQSASGGNGWRWNNVASAWYMLHVFEHWDYGGRDEKLGRRIYPLLREVCWFWEDRLVERVVQGATSLLCPAGWSPEHGPVEDGVVYDQQIVWDLFTNYLELASALDVDRAYRQAVADLRRRLAPNRVGRWGQLQEWQVDRDDPSDEHRHTSHLFAVFPGRQITPGTTPELATAAVRSLRARCGVGPDGVVDADAVTGDSRRSWTWPWRAALFARLGEGDAAYEMFRGLLRHNTLPNLFATHPPLQVDGNLGMPGAIAEMLLQSHEGVVHILPACPPAWQKAGSFAGLRARGGYRVDARWRDGVVESFSVVADRTRDLSPLRVKANGAELSVVPELGADGLGGSL